MDLLHTLHVPAGPGPFTTLLALHGWGASAHDLFGLAPHLLAGEALVLCPQGPVSVPSAPGGSAGHGWFPITGGGPPDRASLAAAAFQLRTFLEDAKACYPIDSEAVYVLGFSQGGVMAYDLVLDAPGAFAGLMALSSWLPAELAERAEPDEALARLPTLVIHGEQDPVIPIDRARESRERLQALGVRVAQADYPMGHEISPQCLRDLVGWLNGVEEARIAG